MKAKRRKQIARQVRKQLARYDLPPEPPANPYAVWSGLVACYWADILDMYGP